MKAKIDKQPVSPKCRLCGTKEETVMHLVSGHPKLAQKLQKKTWQCCQKSSLGIVQEAMTGKLRQVVWVYTCWCRGECWNRIVLGSYHPDRHDSGAQQAIYYPSGECNTEMDNLLYYCSMWLQNRALKSWEISGSSIWGKENPSCRDSHSTSLVSRNSTKVTLNWAFRHWWLHSQHSNDNIVGNSRNTMQSDESLSYKS